MAEDSIDFEIRIEGLDKAREKLKQLAEKLPKQADRILQDEGDKILYLSRSIVPVDTGNLLNSSYHNHTFLRSDIGYNADYAAFVEFGTSRMDAQPYFFPSIDAYMGEIAEMLAKALTNA